jgi:MoaA/NifB/PqqE/SkfB family radical SAM enzyme
VKLAFYFTLACTARCDHCITFAGPKVRRKMTLDDARLVVEAVAGVPQLDGIVFTGGENFIHRQELLELVRDCTERRLKSEVITNAFWATNPGAAREAIAPFREAGLNVLLVSIDRYHLPYVTTDRVHTALDAMRDVGFERHITCVVEQRNTTYAPSRLSELVERDLDRLASWDEDYAAWLTRELRHDWPAELVDLLETYDFDLDTCLLLDDARMLREERRWPGGAALCAHLARTRHLIRYQFLATEGRGRMLVGQVEDKHIDDTPDLVCDSVISTPTMTPEGDLFPCCSSWVNLKHQAVGNVHETELGELLDRVNSDPIALFMRYQGPGALVKFLRARDASAQAVNGGGLLRTLPVVQQPLPDRYTHHCHLCGVLLERYTRPQLETAIRAFYEEHPWRLIISPRGLMPFTAEVAPA